VDGKFNNGAGGLHWELGNELWGDWNLGSPTLEQLPGRTHEVSKAIYAVDPNAKLIATGQDPDNYEQWNAAQLTNPAGTFNFLSTHFVVTVDQTLTRNPSPDFIASATFALPVELARRLHKMQEQINASPRFAGKARVAFTEWLYLAHRNDAPRYDNMGGAIGAAGFFNMLMKSADVVPISDMTGIMEFAGIWKKRSQVYAAPSYYAFQMYAGADATQPVQVIAHSGEYSVHQGVTRLPEIADVPYLDVVAARNDAGNTLTLFVVNRHLTRDFETNIQLSGFASAASGKVQTLQSDSLYDKNSEQDPENVIPSVSAARVTGNHLRYVFPHESVTVITLKTK
jgi:alpha-L-arabinofuranosidase